MIVTITISTGFVDVETPDPEALKERFREAGFTFAVDDHRGRNWFNARLTIADVERIVEGDDR